MISRTIGLAFLGFMLTASASAVAADFSDGFHRRVVVHNQGTLDAVEVFAPNRYWSQYALGEDRLLGQPPIRPGETRVVEVDDGSGYCIFDIRVELSDGTAGEINGINACNGEALTLSD